MCACLVEMASVMHCLCDLILVVVCVLVVGLDAGLDVTIWGSNCPSL